MAIADASRVRPLPVQPARSARRSRTIQPMLWRVFAYWSPGFPRPTTIFTGSPVDRSRQTESCPRHAERARSRPGRARGNPTVPAARAGARCSDPLTAPTNRDGRRASRARRSTSALASGAGQQPLLQAAHRALLADVGVIPAAQVERAMGHEQPELVSRRPPDIAGLPSLTGGRLVHRPLDGDDEIAE